MVGASANAATQQEDPDLQALAAKSYSERNGVSIAEATQQLEIQDEVAGLADRLDSELDGAYGGVWFSPGAADPVKVGVDASPNSAVADRAEDEVAEQGVAEEADVVSVPASLDDLAAAQRRLISA